LDDAQVTALFEAEKATYYALLEGRRDARITPREEKKLLVAWHDALAARNTALETIGESARGFMLRTRGVTRTRRRKAAGS